MKALITGATGFVGLQLVSRLIMTGYEVYCLVRKSSDVAALQKKGVELVYGDILDVDSLKKAVRGMDHIYHLVGIQSFSEDKRLLDKLSKVNVQGSKNLLEALISLDEMPKKVIYLSSTACVGLTNGEVDESVECHPESPYQITKYLSEKMFLDYHTKHGVPVVVIRASMIYGPGGDHSQVLRMAKMINNGLFPIIGSGKNCIPLIHINDLISALVGAAEHGSPGGVFFITNKDRSNLNQLVQALSAAIGKKPLVIRLPVPIAGLIALFSEPFFRIIGKTAPISKRRIQSMTADRLFSVERAEKDFSFVQEMSLQEGINDAVGWYKEHNYTSPSRVV